MSGRVQISRIVYRYLVVALAINVYLAPGQTVSEKLENALHTMFGAVLEPLQSWTAFQNFYAHLNESGAIHVIKVAGLCKAISYTLRRKNQRRMRVAEEETDEKKKKKKK